MSSSSASETTRTVEGLGVEFLRSFGDLSNAVETGRAWQALWADIQILQT
jgi:hypothetical protein